MDTDGSTPGPKKPPRKPRSKGLTREQRQKLSDARRSNWRNNDYRKRITNAIRAGHARRKAKQKDEIAQEQPLTEADRA